MRNTELSFWVGVRRAASHCNSLTLYTPVWLNTWFWVKGDQSLHLCLPNHGTLPSITQSLFGFAAISFHHRAPPCRCKLLFVSALWRSENYSANVQRETISAVCLCVCVLVFVGVGTDVRGAGVQGHCRTNSLTGHLLELRQTQRDTRTKKEE